jgi:GT2 family glycosyltransferase
MFKVSIIIPTYQRCGSVKRALAALNAQSFPADEFEVIVSIDGSNDGTREMVSSFEANYKLRAIWNKNSGRASACNRGIQETYGELLIILDDDMEPDPGFVEAHYAAHRAGDRLSVIGAAPIIIGESAPAVVRYIGTKFNTHLEKISEPGYTIRIWDFYSGNFSIRRANLMKAGLFSEDFVDYGNEDVELAWRLQNLGIDITYSPEAKCIQHYEKDFGGLALDTIASGRTSVLLSIKHPDTFDELKLAEFHSTGWKWRTLRLALIWFAIYIPGTVSAIISLIKLFDKLNLRGQEKAYFLALDYFYWLGVWSALRESDNGTVLAAKIKSPDNSRCPTR